LINEPRHRLAALELHDFLSADASDASLMLSELQTKLAPFINPRVAATVEHSDFDLDDVLSEPTLLVVGTELELRARGAMAAALLLNRVTALLSGRYGRSGGVPVILLLDEAPVLAKRINLAAMLATLRATRAGIVLAAQNATQFGDGDARSTIFDACDTMMLLPGASEASLRQFQSRLGQREVRRMSVGHELGNRGGSYNVAGERAPMVGDRELLAPPFGRRVGFVHSRSTGLGPVAIELDRLLVSSVTR
jgi:type IV secretory pathway TraG/TraD family ATPase VirD4